MRQGRSASLILCATLCVGAVVCNGGKGAKVEGQAVRGDKVLFVSNRDGEKFNIFTMNADGSGQTNLTRSDMLEFDPAWSPDGKQIAFAAVASLQEQRSDIFVMDADGKNRKRITQSDTIAFGPAWSPDGKRIAFSTMQMDAGNPPKMYLYVMDADGRNRKQLREGMVPAWAPDGKKILYTTMEEGGGFEPRLYVMDADGSNAKQMVSGKAMMGVWSPDGKRIVYMGEGPGDQPDIFVMNADGSQRTPLTKTEQDMEFGPQWSADGKRIFFTRLPQGRPSQSAIYATDADGKNVKQLTNNDAMNFFGSGAVFLRGVARDG